MPDFIEPLGLVVPLESLRLPKAVAVVNFLTTKDWPYIWLVECRASSEEGYKEIVVFDVEVERPQVLEAEILAVERIAAVFTEADSTYPKVFALRSDFPEVLHLFQEKDEFPRSLCLYERPWRNLRLSWTAPSFVEQIREWLSKTAEGVLHQEDQQLEPIILGVGYHIVLPPEVFDAREDSPDKLDVYLVRNEGIRVFLTRGPEATDEPPAGLRYIALILKCDPQKHQVLSRTPTNLKDLCQLVSRSGLDLLSHLRSRFDEWTDSKEDFGSRLILLINFPKTRTDGGPVEQNELRAFLFLNNLDEIGAGIGVRGTTPEGERGRLVPIDEAAEGDDIPVLVLNPHSALTWDFASVLNGLTEREDRKIIAIGAGALGSQVIMNLVRAGYGRWFIVDKDVVFPHNLARHVLQGGTVGFNKAQALAFALNTLAQDTEIAGWLEADVFDEGEDSARLNEELEGADVILDMAASVSVSRHLTYHSSEKRRIALFMNPTGKDLVLLAEDPERTIKLDSLEMQYYRGLLMDGRLAHHFTETGSRVRYGQSCRDLSSRIPQDLVAMHAAIAARAIKSVLSSSEPVIRVWVADHDWASTESVEIPIAPVTVVEQSGWSLIFDDIVLEKAFRFRAGELPNETGGVLIGTHDMERKKMYVVDVLPSPPDSEEWPSHYIRGCQDLVDRVTEVREKTGQNLDYVGEWHSHPDGYGTGLSSDDQKALASLTVEMAMEGKPAAMLIVGDKETAKFYTAVPY